MNIPGIIIKATGLATCVFWLILIAFEGLENFHLGSLGFIIISLLPIGLCCTISILVTIAPFFWFKKRETDNRAVFNTYFPFYAIASFGLCFYGSLIKPNVICFFASAFITTMQTWIWLGKDITVIKHQEL